MKKTSRKQCRTRKNEPTPEQISQYVHCLTDEHQLAWQAELTSTAPHWVYLIGLHLRMCELEHLESAAGELL
jgi:hypothetical protein